MKLSRMEIQADRPAIVLCYTNLHDNEAFSLKYAIYMIWAITFVTILYFIPSGGRPRCF